MISIFLNNKIKVFTALVVFLFIFLQSTFIVQQTEQAIVLQFGKIVNKKILQPGLHFKVPFLQQDVHFDNRLLGFASEMREAIAADQKRVLVDTYTKYQIIDPLLFFQSVRDVNNLAFRFSPIIESITREEIAKINLNSFVAEGRSRVIDIIKKNAEISAKQFGIKIIDVRVKSVGLPQDNLESIFSRMKTDRTKEAKEIRAMGFEQKSIIVSEADKESTVILSDAQLKSLQLRGEADAKATKIYNDAFGLDLEYFQYLRYIDIYKKTLNKNNTFFVLNQDNDYLKFLLKNLGHNNK